MCVSSDSIKTINWKKDNLYYKKLPGTCLGEYNSNVLYNGQAVVHTVSLLSKYKEKRKKDKLYYKKLPVHSWPELHNVLYNGQAVVHTVSLLSVYKEKHKNDKLYYKKASWHPPGRNSTMFSTMARLLCTPSISSLCIKKSIKRTNYIIKSLPAHARPEFNNVVSP
jgi:hypothetical protein